MEHVQQEFEGSTIQEWELNHGIARRVVNGVEYVVCTNWNGFNAKCEEDQKRYRTQRMMQAQEEAYMGG